MLSGRQMVRCQISDAALDDLAEMKGMSDSTRMTQFLALRDTIEQTASQLFDERPGLPGSIVKIFSKHVQPNPDDFSRGQNNQACE